MKRAFLLCVAALSLLAISCVSVPMVASPSGVDASLRAYSAAEVQLRFGTISAGNDPYVTPGTLLSNNPDQYVVVEIDIAAAREAKLSILQLVATTPDGKRVASFIPWDQFSAYTTSWQEDAHTGEMQLATAERTYLKTTDFVMKPGRRSYMAVLLGKTPFPKDFTIELTYGVDDTTSTVSVKGKL